MVLISALTKKIGDIAQALDGKWGVNFTNNKCRYLVLGHIAVCECFGDVSQYNFNFDAMGWHRVSEPNARGFALFITLTR